MAQAEIALIPPIAHIEKYCTRRPTQMLLAHLVQENQTYVDNYAQVGGYKILDNGAWEKGEPLPLDLLLELGDYADASCIVLPDKLRDAQTTIDLSRAALRHIARMAENQFDWAFVVQGTYLYEFFVSLSWALTQPGVDVIMLPKLMEPLVPGGRAGFLTWLNACHPERYQMLQTKRIHLLGIWHNPLEVTLCLGAGHDIASMDSALPFHTAYHGESLHPRYGCLSAKSKRHEDYFDLVEPEGVDIGCFHNIQVLDQMAKLA